MPKPLKKLIGRAVLRGPMLRAWHLKQCQRLDDAYCREVVRESGLPLAKPVKVSFTPRPKIRTILLVADVMWEIRELVPEFCKICEVVALDLHPDLERQVKKSPPSVVVATMKQFIDNHKGLEPDVILFYARGSILSDEVFHHLRKRWKCPLFGMNLDDKATFFDYHVFSSGDDNYGRWAAKFDLNLTNTLVAVEWYHRLGLPCAYFPQGVNLPADLPPPDRQTEFQYLFSFVGSSRHERRLVVDRLREFQIPITLFGPGWPESQWADSPTRIYRASQINLGIGLSIGTGTQTTVKNRDFECPGVGACYLTTYNWELLQHYEAGKEILLYRSVEELIEMFAYYRKRPEICLGIAQAAYRRAAAEHTWEKRFRNIFRETGLTS